MEGCPVPSETGSPNETAPSFKPPANDSSSSSSFWSRLWWPTESGFTSSGSSSGSSATVDACPVPSTPSSLEQAAQYAQTPQPDQTVRLATARQVSSIPRGESSSLPQHQPNTTTTTTTATTNTTNTTTNTTNNTTNTTNNNNWVYPSEQQLYNAMRRKGWNNIPEESIEYVLQIHNVTNERTWRQIQLWEGLSESSTAVPSPGAPTLRLARFHGRPRDLSPKAFVYHKLLGQPAPFDRHDWYVERTDTHGRYQRYVIDYYETEPVYAAAPPGTKLPPVTYVDVRPALDHPRAVVLTGQRFLADAFPGIASRIRRLFPTLSNEK
jgi:cytochrome c heme-lyase